MDSALWKDRFVVGIPEIDEEHRGLFDALEELSTALAAGERARALDTLRPIAEHALSHFAHEERMMRRAGYSGYKWHRAQHETAKKRLSALIQEARGAGLPECQHVAEFLKAWMPDHITLHDCMMSAALRNYRRLDQRNKAAQRQVFA